MKILLAGGGTAGHINPALAIAGTVRDKIPSSEILYVGAKGGMEEKLVPQAGYEFKSIKISGFKRSFSPSAIAHNIATAKRAVTSSMEAKKIIKPKWAYLPLYMSKMLFRVLPIKCLPKVQRLLCLPILTQRTEWTLSATLWLPVTL